MGDTLEMHEFTEKELVEIRNTLGRHYGAEVGIQLSSGDHYLDGEQTEPITCIAVTWHRDGTNFAVFKIGQNLFRCRYFYTPHEQYEPGPFPFINLDKCICTVLESQAEHDRHT